MESIFNNGGVIGKRVVYSQQNFISATGGTITDITDNGTNYRVHTFTSSGTFEVTSGSGDVEYLIVAGGGGGGSSAGSSAGAGGGGAGGVITGTTTVNENAYQVIVGSGGAGTPSNTDTPGSDGSDSSAFSEVAIGGGGGGPRGGNGRTGGSGGGGGAFNNPGGSGAAGQGNDGGKGGDSTTGSGNENAGGGGGGAGLPGQDGTDNGSGGNGGDGISVGITGTSVFYGGGGGGGITGGNGRASGGSGGGGEGGEEFTAPPTEGSPNTGGGGGGAGGTSHDGKKGGSGIVIIRYPIDQSQPAPTPELVTTNLTMHLDAGDSNSYPGSGTTWTDLTSNNYTGTLLNGVSYTSSDGGALLFDGNDDNVDFNDILDMRQNSMTTITWIKVNAVPSGNRYFVSKAAATFADSRYAVGIADSSTSIRPFFCADAGNDIIGNTTEQLTLGQWQMVTAVFDRTGEISVYINDTLASFSSPPDISGWQSWDMNSSFDYRIASYSNSSGTSEISPVDCDIAIHLHYDRALTQSEVQQNFNATKSRFGF